MLDFDPANLDPERIRRIRRREYERMVEMGMFVDERIELLHGVLVEMSPQGTRHAEAVARANERLLLALQGRARIRPQLPLAQGEWSEPEPDLAVVPTADYSDAHPDAALLAVEVADSSRQKDRTVKAPLYASTGVFEYWLVDLVDDVIDVFTSPLPEEGRYAKRQRYARGEHISLHAFPDVRVAVDAILPTPR